MLGGEYRDGVHQDELPLPLSDRREEIARRWARALAGTSYVPLSVGEISTRLRALTDRLVAVLLADPFAPHEARSVGATLVGLHFTQPASLGRTTETLCALLLADLPTAQQHTLLPRVAAVLGAVAAGFADAARADILTAQEAIRDAVVAAQTEAEEALRVSEARFQAVFAEAPIGMGIGDMTGRILTANRALQEMFGYRLEEFRHLTVGDFVHPDDAAAVWASYSALIRGERDEFRIEKRFMRKDERVIWSHLTVSLVRSAAGVPQFQIAMLEDITSRKALEAELAHRATHDALTGLPNRALFLDRLRDALARDMPDGGTVAVLMVDLDGFKAVNDQLGHEAGDHLLVAAGGRLGASVRESGQTLARLGGDEFVLLLEEAGWAEAEGVARRLIDALASPFAIGGHAVTIAASAGVAVAPAGQGEDAAGLLRVADAALYRAKAAGRGRYAVGDAGRADASRDGP